MTPSYRERLRLEGFVLAGAGAVACALLIAVVPEASERSSSTIGQLAFVALLLGVLAPLTARRSIADARPVEAGETITGSPTALWKPPLVLVALMAVFVIPGELGVDAAGWDAGLRIAGGCLLVGLAQALVMERIVAADERRTGRSYVRVGGWSVTRGTALGFFRNEQV